MNTRTALIVSAIVLLAACESGETPANPPIAESGDVQEEVNASATPATEVVPSVADGKRGADTIQDAGPSEAAIAIQPPPAAKDEVPAPSPPPESKPVDSKTPSAPPVVAKPAPADTTPPETAFGKTPSLVTRDTSHVFEFTSTEAASTFMCQLDVGTPSPCTSPLTLSAVEGSHTISLYAVDTAGNKDPTPASFAWTVDVTPPAFGGIVSAKVVSTTQVDLAWKVPAEASAILHICRSTTSGSCISSFTSSYTTPPGAAGHSVTGLTPSATYFFVVRSQDAAGNVDSNTVEKSVKMALGPVLAYELHGQEEFEMLGWSVTTIEDLDGDERGDFVVGASGTTAGEIVLAGSVAAYSGATGSLIVRAVGTAVGDQLGFSVVAAGDVNADGTPDFGAGAPTYSTEADPFTGAIRVFSGLDGSLLAQRHGEAMNGLGGISAELGDVNDDGVKDCAWGRVKLNEADQSMRKAVDVGPCGGGQDSVLYTIMADLTEEEFGAAISSAGDLDGDGRDDVLVGSPLLDLGGQDDVGRVYLYSGATGVLIRSMDGTQLGGEFGRSVATLGDVDGDGIPEFAVGEPAASVEGVDTVGRVCAYSGAAGTMIVCIHGGEGVSGYGMGVASVGDFDNDGKRDLAVWAPDPARTFVDILSSADGLRLHRLDAPDVATLFGISMASADLNGDGKSDLVIGAPMASPNGLQFAGGVYVYLMP